MDEIKKKDGKLLKSFDLAEHLGVTQDQLKDFQKKAMDPEFVNLQMQQHIENLTRANQPSIEKIENQSKETIMETARETAKAINSMTFHKLPLNSRELLRQLNDADNPTEVLSEKCKSASGRDKSELRGIIKELSDAGYITVQWASNMPYRVIIHNTGLTYEEQLADYEKEKRYSQGSSITIGDHNKIKNSNIGNEIHNPESKKGFTEHHPVMSGIFIAAVAAVIAGFLLMFNFWQDIVDFIERIF